MAGLWGESLPSYSKGHPVASLRLAFNALAGNDALTQALAADPRIAPFMAVTSKENGLDIKGHTARGDLLQARLNTDTPTLSLAHLRIRHLNLSGLSMRDLALFVPDWIASCCRCRQRHRIVPWPAEPTALTSGSN